MMQECPRRIGILGGTFNPVHAAHIVMAKGVKDLLSLDEVLLIVAQDPPHKQVQGHVDALLRYEMVCLSAKAYEGLTPCDIEMKRPGKSYTTDTLHELELLYPSAQWFVIVGSDMLQDLPTWRNAPDLLKEAVFVAVPRKGQNAADEQAAQLLRHEYGADVRLVSLDIPPISSTLIRNNMEHALPIAGLVSPAVERYIYETGLYLPEQIKRMQEKCRAALNTNRYKHTMGVVRMAEELAQRHGVDPEQARLAALLHDCGRGVDKGSLTHAITGERIAREEYGVTDEAVLQAIRRHTTLGISATKLDKLIYLADMVEYGRKYKGVEELRRLAMENLDSAAIKGLTDTILYVQEKGLEVHSDSINALHELGASVPLNQ